MAAEIASLRNTTARAQTVEHMQSQMDTIQSEIAKKLSTHQAKMFEMEAQMFSALEAERHLLDDVLFAKVGMLSWRCLVEGY